MRDGRADLIWLNSVQTLEDVARACKRDPRARCWWSGAARYPAPSPGDYEAAGAKIALYPTVFSTIGISAAWRVMHDFFERGPVAQHEFLAQMRDSKWGPDDRRALLGHGRVREIEERFLPERDQRDYDHTLGR